jgi:hypothetical protein
MKKTQEFTKKVFLKATWKFLPQQKKYAILWARTMKSLAQPAPVHIAEHSETLVGG